MDLGLLTKIFGSESNWHGPCWVLLDAEASISRTGQDSIISGGSKAYAPRIPSGRVTADAVCFSPEHRAMLLIQRQTTRQPTGVEVVEESLLIVDVSHVVGLQFEKTGVLDLLGVPHPVLPEKQKYAPGTLVG